MKQAIIERLQIMQQGLQFLASAISDTDVAANAVYLGLLDAEIAKIKALNVTKV